MLKRSIVVLSLASLGAFALAAVSPAVQKDPSGPPRDQSSHLQRGVAAFEQGFYEFLPKNRKAEAVQAFGTAIRELELALETEPNSREAHRTLARAYAVRQDHLAAASHYRRLTEIDPYDIDSYALAALSLAEAGRFAESKVELEKAKGRTADPHALTLLDDYLRKLAEAEKQAGAGR